MNNHFCELRNYDIEQLSSMKTPAVADYVFYPYCHDGICELIDRYSNNFLLVGKGSNTIFEQNHYSTPIICTDFLKHITYIKDDHCIRADSGVSLHDLAWFAMENRISGYEFLEDIPGSVGGALYMNAGTYDDSISQLVLSVTVYNIKNKSVEVLREIDLSQYWGKRLSYFMNNDSVILSCDLKASSFNDDIEILDKMLTIKKERYRKQPRNFPSAGSVFKRPYDENGNPRYVWQLLTEAGLKGKRIGGAQVSEKHPGFIVNVDNATGKDVVSLMVLCKEEIKKRYNINLEEEWRIV